MSGQKPASCLQKSGKTAGLPNRWPVLNKIMNKASARKQVLYDINGDLCINAGKEHLHSPAGRSKMSSPVQKFRVRVLHAASPTFPSLLSGVEPIKRHTLARHCYVHHGHSQSSLFYQRDFWERVRRDWEDEYGSRRTRISYYEEAYGGILEEELCSTPESYINSSASGDNAQAEDPMSSLVNKATFPRFGVLSSLHDDSAVAVDTWFADLPLWTLSKLVWMSAIRLRLSFDLSEKLSDDSVAEEIHEGNESTTTLITLTEEAGDMTMVDSEVTNAPIKPWAFKDFTSTVSGLSGLYLHDKESNWSSRWGMLYVAVNAAMDMLALRDILGSPNSDVGEVAKAILTSPTMLCEPFNENMQHDRENATMLREKTALSVEDEEDDYGEILQNPLYRLSANLDSHTMFASAERELPDDFSPHGARHNPSFVTHSSDDNLELTQRLELFSLYT